MRKFYFVVALFLVSYLAKSQVINFEDLTLPPNSYWNGNDQSGGFTSGSIASFPNVFIDWGNGITSWSGFAYSNMLDTVTQSFSNEFSCYAGEQTPNSTVFAISYNSIDWMTGQTIPNEISFSQPIQIQSIDVTNTTYAALTMLNGDSYSKKFGGITGDDPDWFKLTITGYYNGNITNTIDFYLADYRFNDNQLDYIVKSWQTVDITALGLIDKLSFNLSSSDTGIYGMNTPAYFCFDNIVYQLSSEISTFTTYQNLKIYPNPASDYIHITEKANQLNIYNLSGKLIAQVYHSNFVDIRNYQSGTYIIEVFNNDKVFREIFVKK